MAAGLRDLLVLQGVAPLSSPLVTAVPGLTLGQASGVWITGGPPGTVVTVKAGASGDWLPLDKDQQILEEDDIAMMIAAAFIEIMNR